MKVASSHFLACIWGGAPSCWKLKLPSAFKAVRAFRTKSEALKTAVNRFTARLRGGNVIPATLLAAALEEHSPAYVKIVSTSNMAYGHVNKSSG